MSKEAIETTLEETDEKTGMEGTEDAEKVVERPYTLRKLRDDDLFPLLNLFRSIGLKEFKDAWLEARKKMNVTSEDLESADDKDEVRKSVGIDIVLDMADIMISKIEAHSDAIYRFYERLSGIPADDIKSMEFGTLPLMIYDSFNGVKNTAFFKVVFKLL